MVAQVDNQIRKQVASLLVASILATAGTSKLLASWRTEDYSTSMFNEQVLDFVAFSEIALAASWIGEIVPFVLTWAVTAFITLVFVLFAVVSKVLGLSSCGCFGGLAYNYETSLEIFSILTLTCCLWISLPGKSQFQELRGSSYRLCLPFALCAICWVPWIAVTKGKGREWMKLPVAHLAVSMLRSDGSINVSNADIDLGQVRQLEELSLEFVARNKGRSPIQLNGFFRTCSCLKIPTIPTKILGGNSQPLHVSFHPPERLGPFEVSGKIFTNSSGQPEIPFTLRCEVIPAANN
jgi:hypothetical protein